MVMNEPMDVHLYGTHVGKLLRAGPDTVCFEMSPDGFSSFGVGSCMLSQSLPLGPRNPTPAAASAFFGGLLPEGLRLTTLARRSGVPSDDIYSLIRYAGYDLAGATTISESVDDSAGHYEPLSDEQVALRLQQIYDPMSECDRTGMLAGYQPKITLALLNGAWHAGVDGAASTHIIKPIGAGAEPALHAEAYCLELARYTGLTSFDSHIYRFGDRLTLIIERYDRTVLPDGTVERIHQEDAAQALGLPWRSDSKFEGVNPRASLRNIADILTRRRTVFGDGVDDREALLAFTTFNAAIGNTDAHAKNFSTLHHQDGSITLAPLYDVSANALAPAGNQNMALKVAGKAYQPDITRDDLVAEAKSWGLPAADAIAIVNGTLEQLRYAVEDVDPGSTDERVALYIANQTRNILDGKRAGVSQNEPPAMVQFMPVPPMPRIQGRQPLRGVQGTENAWRAMDAEFGLLTGTEVADLMGSRARSRAGFASDRRKAGKLLGIRRRNTYLYPGFQFDRATGKVLPVIPALLDIAAQYEKSPEGLAQWLCSRTGQLSDGRPVDHLSELERVLEAAENHYGVQW